MSTTLAAVIAIAISAAIYVASNLLSRYIPHSGRDPVNAKWSLSQWNQSEAIPLKPCDAPQVPGNCIIEGVQQQLTTQLVQRVCNAEQCIGFDGTIVARGQTITFNASCNIPFCGWSQCYVSFGSGTGEDPLFVQVTKAGLSFALTQVTLESGTATKFYMSRLESGANGLQDQQDGTIAQFFLLPEDIDPSVAQLFILCYNNQATVPSPSGVGVNPQPVTALEVKERNRPADSLVDMFLLMDAMPQSVSQQATTPATNILPRKVLAFAGTNRSGNPSQDELIQFSTHSQTKMWAAVNSTSGPLYIIRWNTDYNGYYGTVADNYVTALNNWTEIPSGIKQDVVESRLLRENNGDDRPFYIWL